MLQPGIRDKVLYFFGKLAKESLRWTDAADVPTGEYGLNFQRCNVGQRIAYDRVPCRDNALRRQRTRDKSPTLVKRGRVLRSGGTSSLSLLLNDLELCAGV